jgi:hypothetical protein
MPGRDPSTIGEILDIDRAAREVARDVIGLRQVAFAAPAEPAPAVPANA